MINILRSHPMFKELSEGEIETISKFTKEKIIAEHIEFIRRGERAEEVYFIYSGGVRVYLVSENGREVTLALLGPGDVIGEMAFLSDEPRSASAETMQETRLFMLRGTDFKNILRSNPDTAINLLKVLANRIRAADESIEDIYAKSLYERTLKSLQSLSQYFKDGEIPLSQEDLALILGATRPRVSEILSQLKLRGRISYSRKKMTVL